MNWKTGGKEIVQKITGSRTTHFIVSLVTTERKGDYLSIMHGNVNLSIELYNQVYPFPKMSNDPTESTVA